MLTPLSSLPTVTPDKLPGAFYARSDLLLCASVSGGKATLILIRYIPHINLWCYHESGSRDFDSKAAPGSGSESPRIAHYINDDVGSYYHVVRLDTSLASVDALDLIPCKTMGFY